MIDRLKLSQRLALIVLLGVLGGLVTLADSIFSTRGALDTDRRVQLQRLVEGGHGILAHYQALEARGELTREQAQREAVAQLRLLRFGTDSYFWLVDLNRKAILDPLRQDADGNSALAPAQAPDGAFLAASLRIARDSGDGFVEGMWPAGLPATPSAASFVRLFKPWGWVLGSGNDGKEIDSLFMSRATRSGVIGLGASLLLLGGALLVSRSILRQLGGEPAYASAVTQRIAGGDLRNLNDRVTWPAASLVGHLEKMRQGLGGMIQDIRNSAAALQGEAKGLIAVSDRIKASSSTDYESTVWISAAMEEMALSVESVGESAKATGTHSEEAARMAREGGDMVQQSTREIEQIAGVIGQSTGQIETLLRRTGEISGIAGVIKEISDQTNLLALNAAIEAARAGEQGRGFAVVADEVRKLAERTGQSTAEIAGMIRSIQSETSSFVELMRGIGPQVERNLALSRAAAELLESLNTGATDSVGQIREIVAAMDELREISSAIAGKVEQMMAHGEQSNGEIEQSHQASGSIAALGERMAVSVARFEV